MGARYGGGWRARRTEECMYATTATNRSCGFRVPALCSPRNLEESFCLTAWSGLRLVVMMVPSLVGAAPSWGEHHG